MSMDKTKHALDLNTALEDDFEDLNMWSHEILDEDDMEYVLAVYEKD